jgi:hypothetical protein
MGLDPWSKIRDPETAYSGSRIQGQKGTGSRIRNNAVSDPIRIDVNVPVPTVCTLSKKNHLNLDNIIF